MMQRLLFAIGSIAAIGTPVYMSLEKEALLARGETVLLDLAPRDPRSLIQGDYMVLRYAMAREVRGQSDEWPDLGDLVITLDDDGVASFVRRYEGETLAEGERLLDYQLRGSWSWTRDEVWLGPGSFFFEEGTADVYAVARYGELKVSSSGEAVLVGLRGEDFAALGGER